ncbi:MAG: hypothetical protein WD645_05010 [Dehalococcoidia bacterium]
MASPIISGIVAGSYGAASAFWFWAPFHFISAFLLIFVAKESLQKRQPPHMQEAHDG